MLLISWLTSAWILANYIYPSWPALRSEVIAGRTDSHEELSREETTFYDFIVQQAFPDAVIPAHEAEALKGLVNGIVALLREQIGVVDFWEKPVEVKKLRGQIVTEILLANLPALTAQHERIAVEIVKLAENRHQELLG